MPALSNPLVIIRGDTTVLTSPVNNPPQAGITGCQFIFTAKVTYDAGNQNTDNSAPICKTTGAFTIVQNGGGTPPNVQPGLVQFSLLPADTYGFDGAVTQLVYDLQMEDPQGNVTTLAQGTLIILPDVTRSYT